MNIFKSILLIIGVLIALTVEGQERLTAKEAVFRALENNYQMKIAEKREDIATKNDTWSEAGLFPTVELSAAFGNSIIDNTNNPFTFTPGLIANRSISPGLTANWNLFSGFGIYASKKRLELLKEQSKQNELLILENTAIDVLKAYYGAILEIARLDVFKKLYNQSQKQLNLEEKRADYGGANKLSVYQLNNQVFSDSINVIQQKISSKNALRNLILLMNVPMEELENDNFPELVDSLAIPLDPIEKDGITERVLENNQNLKNQIINLELQEKNTKLQQSFLYPTVGVQLGAQPNFGQFNSLSDSNLEARTQQITYFGNVNVRFNLFNNWKDKRAVEVSRIQEDIESYNVQEMEKQLVTTVKNLLETYNVRNNLVNLSEQNVEYAKLAYEIGLERYEMGQINSIELSQLQTSLMNAQLEYLNNLYQRIDIYLEIIKTTGKLQLNYT